MDVDTISGIGSLTTPVLADAVMRLDLDVRVAPPGLTPAIPGGPVAGRVLPARHAGSVDVFFEAMERSEPGDVLVIDNQGRDDEGCIGDLVVIEAREAGLAGIVVWGRHRDHAEIQDLGLPVFSYGRMPLGPRRLDPRQPDALDAARFGEFEVTAKDLVLADVDGAIFAPLERADDLLEAGRKIMETERRQAERVEGGESLRQQMRFAEYLERHQKDPSYSFRQHLREVGGEIEE